MEYVQDHIATCENEDCEAQGDPIPVMEADIYVCGPCGNEITNVRKVEDFE